MPVQIYMYLVTVSYFQYTVNEEHHAATVNIFPLNNSRQASGPRGKCKISWIQNVTVFIQAGGLKSAIQTFIKQYPYHNSKSLMFDQQDIVGHG